jgi:hypothetical protein
MELNGRHDDRKPMPRSYVSLGLLVASAAVFSGCLSAYVGFPSRGTFRVVSVKEDGTLVARRSGGREFGVKMYGIRLKEDWWRQLGGTMPPRVIQLRNGAAVIIEKDGRLVYDQKCEVTGGKDLVSPNIVEADLVTPSRDQNGNILAIVITYSSFPPVLLHSYLMVCRVAEPDPDISGDPFVDSLRDIKRSIQAQEKQVN